MAKTRILKGSRRRLLMGYRERSSFWMSIVVAQTMPVLRKSSTPSTKLASTEREFVIDITTILAASRTTLAMKLMYMARVTMRSALSTWSSCLGRTAGDGREFSSAEVSNRGELSSGILYRFRGVRLILPGAFAPLCPFAVSVYRASYVWLSAVSSAEGISWPRW